MTTGKSILKGLKRGFGRFTKGMGIELYIEFHYKELISQFKEILDVSGITKDNLPSYVLDNQALPIPPQAFVAMKGLEDYLQTIDPKRIFEWISEARPDLAIALASMGDPGAEYIVKFKLFLVDSIKNAPMPEDIQEDEEISLDDEPPKDESEGDVEMVKLSCDDCGHSFNIPRDQVSGVKSCPNCGAETGF